MKRIYYTAVDCGDGSLYVRFYESRECIDLLEAKDPETYRGEGGGWFEVDMISGITVETIEDVLEDIKWMEDDEDDNEDD